MSYGRITPSGFIPADKLGDFSDTPVSMGAAAELNLNIEFGELAPPTYREGHRAGQHVRHYAPIIPTPEVVGSPSLTGVKAAPSTTPMKEQEEQPLGFVARLVLTQLTNLSSLERRSILKRFNPDGTAK